MLGLYDPETGGTRVLEPRHPRLLGLRARGGLRAYVTADLVRRLAEHRKLRVWLDSDAAPEEFNVHPGRGPSPAGLDLDVLTADAEPDPAAPRLLRVGAVDVDPDLLSDPTTDPLAVRLALLLTPHPTPFTLVRDTLEFPDATVREWRDAVAVWAESPSAPMPAYAVAAVVGALEDNLNVMAVLNLMGSLANDPGIAPGAKFEAFAYLDLLLGLDLARHVGRARR